MKRQASTTPLAQIEDPLVRLKKIGQEKGFDNLGVDDLVNTLSVTETERNCIQEATTGQSKSNLWHTLRFLRLTASNFGLVCRKHRGAVPPSVLSTLLSGTDLSSLPAVQYGRQHECDAIAAYEAEKPDFKVHKCGFLLTRVVHF